MSAYSRFEYSYLSGLCDNSGNNNWKVVTQDDVQNVIYEVHGKNYTWVSGDGVTINTSLCTKNELEVLVITIENNIKSGRVLPTEQKDGVEYWKWLVILRLKLYMKFDRKLGDDIQHSTGRDLSQHHQYHNHITTQYEEMVYELL